MWNVVTRRHLEVESSFATLKSVVRRNVVGLRTNKEAAEAQNLVSKGVRAHLVTSRCALLRV